MKFKSSFAQIRALSQGVFISRTPQQVLARYREDLPTESFGLLQDELLRTRKPAVRSFGVLVAPDLLALTNASFPGAPIGFEREIKWAKAVLSRHTALLTRYTELKAAYSGALLRGNLVEATEYLDQIEQATGNSLWLIAARLALLQLGTGLEAQKRYAQHIKDGVGFGGPVGMVAQWVSTRNEGTVTLARFVKEFERTLTHMEPHVAEGWVPYVRFHILAPLDMSVEDAMHVVRLESTRALVDYYEAFLALCQTVAFFGTPQQKSAVGYALKKLGRRITDPRLAVLLTAQGLPGEGGVADAVDPTCYDEFLQGNYQQAWQTAQQEQQHDSQNPVTMLLLAAAEACARETNDSALFSKAVTEPELNESSLHGSLHRHLLAVMQTGAASDSVSELSKLAVNFASFEWAAVARLLLEEESSPHLEARSAAVFHVPRWHPWLLEALGPDHAPRAYVEATVGTAPGNLSQQYALTRTEGASGSEPTGLSSEAGRLLAGYQAYRAGEYSAAAAHGKILADSPHGYFSRRGHRLVANSLLAGGDLNLACGYMAKVYVSQPHLHMLLPLTSAVGELRPKQAAWQQLKASLALPILLDAHAKNSGQTEEPFCAFASEDFLNANGVERPSQLRALAEQFDRAELCYYLRYVCVDAIMDSFIVFSGSHEVVDERLAVCRLLLELDPDNAEHYRLEIKHLLQKQVISKRKHEVEQSRIHVDVEKFRLWAVANLQETYDRYINFLRIGLDAESTASLAEATARAHKLDYDGLLAMAVPNNEPRALFRDLFLALRDAFTLHPDFGLNRYLSTRVRHGALENQLRRPLTAHHLVTQRTSKEGPYQPNTHWREFPIMEEEEKELLDVMLAEFSAEYDALVYRIRTTWMQIRLESSQEGMFEFAYAEGQIALAAAEVTAETTFRDFVDFMVQYFGQSLSASLGLIRKRLREEALPEARDLLNGLQRHVQKLSPALFMSGFDNALNLARTETHTAFSRVTEWFRPTPDVGNTPYKLGDVFVVAEALVREATATFRAPVVAGDMYTELELAHGFQALVDVFVNFFENVVRHAGLETPEAQIWLEANEFDPQNPAVSIMSRNKLGLGVNKAALAEQLAGRQAELDSDQYASSVATEGGSGFFKVHRSLRDFRFSEKEPEPKLFFGLDGDEFVVEVQLPTRLQAELAASDDFFEQLKTLQKTLADESTSG